MKSILASVALLVSSMAFSLTFSDFSRQYVPKERDGVPVSPIVPDPDHRFYSLISANAASWFYRDARDGQPLATHRLFLFASHDPALEETHYDLVEGPLEGAIEKETEDGFEYQFDGDAWFQPNGSGAPGWPARLTIRISARKDPQTGWVTLDYSKQTQRTDGQPGGFPFQRHRVVLGH